MGDKKLGLQTADLVRLRIESRGGYLCLHDTVDEIGQFNGSECKTYCEYQGQNCQDSCTRDSAFHGASSCGAE